MKKALMILFLTSFVLQSALAALESFNVTSKKPHEITIIDSGLASLKARLDLIKRAKKSIDVEYFIYRTDSAGKILTKALIEKAREGVKVRLLFDDFLIGKDFDTFHVHEIEKEGVEVRWYNSEPLIKIMTAQYRNHRKIILVDNEEVITGGRNVGDEYFDLSTDYNFVDRDIHFKGEIAAHIGKTFDVMWDSEEVVQLERPKQPKKPRMHGPSTMLKDEQDRKMRRYKRWLKKEKRAKDFFASLESEELGTLENDVQTLGAALLAEEKGAVCNELQYVSDLPGILRPGREKRRLINQEMYKKLDTADYVYIDSPYFLMDDKFSEIFKGILEEEKQVKVLTNGMYSTDAIYVATVFNDLIDNWLRRGLELSMYSGRSIPDSSYLNQGVADSRWGTHSKSFIFNDDKMMIGSYNFDPHSFTYNLEMAFFCNDGKELVDILKGNIEKRMDNSHYITNKKELRKYKYDGVGLLKILGGLFLKIPGHLLIDIL